VGTFGGDTGTDADFQMNDEDQFLFDPAEEYEKHITGDCSSECEYCLAEQEEITGKKPKRNLISKGERTLKWRG